MKDLIAKLEAALEGSQELDARVYCERLGIEFDKMNDPASNPNDPLSFIFHVKGGQRYTCWGQDAVTRSLDAKVPGENIVEMNREEDGWNAWHEDKRGKHFMGTAHTEPLARRIAGLRGIMAVAEKDAKR